MKDHPMNTTHGYLGLLEVMRETRARVELGIQQVEWMLRKHIQANPEACHLCGGEGTIEIERDVYCCDGYEEGKPICCCGGRKVPELFTEDCPYGCVYEPTPEQQEALARSRKLAADNIPF